MYVNDINILMCFNVIFCFKYNYTFFLFVAAPVYLELYLENIMCKNVSSSVMISNEMNVNSIKIFALNDLQQTFILSGPENYDGKFVYTYIIY